jgi:hypothetical protein
MNIEELADMFPDDNILVIDGMDAAIIGIEVNDVRLIYSKKKIIEILCSDMSEEDAQEYYSFNILNSYVGPSTPIFCDDTIHD